MSDSNYWMNQASALHKKVRNANDAAERAAIAYQNMRFIAIAGWVVAIGMYVLGSMK